MPAGANRLITALQAVRDRVRAGRRVLMLSTLVSQKLGTFVTSENAEDLRVLGELIESGKLSPAIDRTYPLSDTAAAIRYVQEGRARGKVVITV